MSWIEDATEVLAEGVAPEGKRMQIIAAPVEYSGDLMPDGDGYVPTVFLGFHYGFSVESELNGDYFPMDSERLREVVGELYGSANDLAEWKRAVEVLLLGMGAKQARVRRISLDRSHWGIMVSAYGQKWQDMLGVDDGYTITDDDTEEFENWLKGEVSWVSARVADHDCNCEYCEVEWAEMDDVVGMSVCADPWDIQHEIGDKYAHVLADMIALIAQSEVIRRKVAA